MSSDDTREFPIINPDRMFRSIHYASLRFRPRNDFRDATVTAALRERLRFCGLRLLVSPIGDGEGLFSLKGRVLFVLSYSIMTCSAIRGTINRTIGISLMALFREVCPAPSFITSYLRHSRLRIINSSVRTADSIWRAESCPA